MAGLMTGVGSSPTSSCRGPILVSGSARAAMAPFSGYLRFGQADRAPVSIPTR